MPNPEKVSAVELASPYYSQRTESPFITALFISTPIKMPVVGILNDERLGSHPWSWPSEAQAAFDNLKVTLTAFSIIT